MRAWPGGEDATGWQLAHDRWVRDNNACRIDVIERLRRDGPLPSSELPDTCVRPWRSSGWNNNRNLRMMLELLVQRGEVAVAGWEGRDRLWDLAERIYPDDPGLGVGESLQLRDERRLASLGIARMSGAATQVEPVDVRVAGEPAVIDGLRGTWRVDPTFLGTPFRGRTALLSPFDRLLADRKRMGELFEFEYVLEMYKPEAQRRWGYYALPILSGDRLVGKVDARADPRAGVLRVHAVHEDEPFSASTTRAVDREIADLAQWLELELLRA
ncbi:MAG TPA: crosslink repair DNA glycosylase YcaQ family protein, partial [Cellulomonas sp.]|nr:crosslink repair DNA glycosylase YcaQ family protein [Cellulomonas sp.]